jgi:hypothetical protein
MSNEENFKNFWKFQQFVKSEQLLEVAEEQIKTVRHTLEDAVYRVKETGELTEEDFVEYKGFEELLYKVQRFITDQNKKTGEKRIQVARNLESELRRSEN